VKFRSIGIIIFSAFAGPAVGATVFAPSLGNAGSFGMLGGTISNTGTSQVIGNVGAMTTITGFPPATATGTISLPATAAYNDFLTAFSLANSNVSTPSTQTVGGLTTSQTFLGNNVFQFSPTDVVSTTGVILTFDAQADANEVFIMRTTQDLIVNGTLTFSLINGAQASHIYWIVGRSATISPSGVPETFDGNILAGSNFTMSANTGGSGVLAGVVNGCVFATNANTLAGQTIIEGCGASTSSVPEPDSSELVTLGGLLGVLALCKFRSVPAA
jgi:hypothetical protein